MKQLFIILFLAGFMVSCTINNHPVAVSEPYPDPVVVSHGVTEQVVGYEEVQVDTFFAYPGMRALENMDMDEVTCADGQCHGTYTFFMDLVDQAYEITVRNDGTESAYGLSADLRVRVEEPDPYDPYTMIVAYDIVTIYMADELEPDWQVTAVYDLYDNEAVEEFMGIVWDDYDTYISKTGNDKDHYQSLAKASASSRIKITKTKVK
jgi:hypothetical protein